MSRWIWMALLALWVGACGDSSETSTGSAESAQTGPEESTTTSEAAEAVEGAEAAEEAPQDGTQDLAGITAVLNDDGTITVSGTDRWGGPLDTVYADAEYLKNAIPVLRRSITDEQANALEAYVDGLGGDGEGADEGAELPEEAAGGDGEE